MIRMFDNYRERMSKLGGCIRLANKKQSINIMESGFEHSQSYRKVKMNGAAYDARIISDSKTTVRGGNGNYVIQFRDGVNPPAGTYVDIPDNRGTFEPWLILYESDSALFPKHIIKKCNYLLKWKNSNGDIIERWAVFEDNSRIRDGVSYMQGNSGRSPYNSKALILPCDIETINIRLDKRFLIDKKYVKDNPDAWIVTNRNIISKVFDEMDGVIELNLSQHQYNNDLDNRKLMIADYYKEYDKFMDIETSNYDCKISYNKSPDLKMGTPFKKYTAEFFKDGVLDSSIEGVWEILIPDDREGFTYQVDKNVLKIKCDFNSKLIGTHIRIRVQNEEFGCSREMMIKVVSSI